jgi:hypothetical protein
MSDTACIVMIYIHAYHSGYPDVFRLGGTHPQFSLIREEQTQLPTRVRHYPTTRSASNDPYTHSRFDLKGSVRGDLGYFKAY